MSDDIDVTIEPEEDGAEIQGDKKLKKLRDELKSVKQERDNNLAGWQRSKADYVNLSRRMREQESALGNLGTVRVAKSIVGVFDSLDAALESAAEEGTKKGIEQVIKQLEQALGEHGVTRYIPKAGEPFNPERHEPVQTVATDDEKMDNTISNTFQSGFEMESGVIRPARVAVAKHD